MRVTDFRKPNENFVALIVTFVLFFCLFLMKVEENRNVSIDGVINVSEIELASRDNLD